MGFKTDTSNFNLSFCLFKKVRNLTVCISDGSLIAGWVEIYLGIFRTGIFIHERILLSVLWTSLNIIIIVLLRTVMIESNFETQLLAIFVANFSV